MNKHRKIMFILLVLLLIICYITTSFSATYYIDYTIGSDSNNGTSTSAPWKHMPGMSGWTGSAILSSGDTVVLKGGVTWTFTSTAADLITVGTAGITIQGGQRLGAPWGAGYPVLDATGTTAAGRSGIVISSKSNITIDGIKIYNTEFSPSGGTGIKAAGLITNLEIKNCYLDHTGDQSILLYPSNGTSHILIHHNTTSNVGRLFIAVADKIVVDDIQIYNNTFLGTGSWPGALAGVHGDGMMIGSACTGSNTCLTNLKIHHNKFAGDWVRKATALIFLNNGTGAGSSQYGGNHVEIYDNQLTIDTDGYISPGLIAVWSKWNDIKIYNNTFGAPVGGVNPVSSCITFWDHGSTNVDIKNNIFSGCTHWAISVKSTSITSIDYNVYSPEIVRMINGWVGTSDCRTAEACYSSFGQEQHGLRADPRFVTLPTGSNSGDWKLQASSPAIGKGVDLSASFTTDLLGNVRPTGAGTWDIGAYEYVTAQSGSPATGRGKGIKPMP